MKRTIEQRLDELEAAVFGGQVQSGVYRCSCCNKLKERSNKLMKPWEQGGDDTRVAICRHCNMKIIRAKCRSVLEYLEANNEPSIK